MTTQDEITRTANRLRDALGAAADVMAAPDSPVLVESGAESGGGRGRGRARGWLLPLTAAASVVVIVLATVFIVGHVGRSPAPGGVPVYGAGQTPPKFYLTSGQISNKPVLEVRRTTDGAVTGWMPAPGRLTGPPGGDASDRAFYIATIPDCTTAIAVSSFYRIAITNSGRISGVAAVGAAVKGQVTDLAVTADGSRIAYTLSQFASCEDPGSDRTAPTYPQDVVHIMDLSTGAVRTWRNTVTAASPVRVLVVNGLSWAPDGRTLVVDYFWAQVSGSGELAVLGLDTASGGGSLQAHSRVLWSQDQSCVTCAREAIAGPDGSLIVDAVQSLGPRQSRQLVFRILLAAGHPRTVLFSEVSPTPAWADVTAVFADPSGQWVIVWPLAYTGNSSWQAVRAGWVSGGQLHPLPGTSLTATYVIAW